MGLGDGRGVGSGRGYGYGYGRGFGHGKGEFSGYSCVKIVFFGFNVIFWLLGCAVLGIGIWLQVSKGQYASLAPSLNFLSATVLCIGAGVLILVIGFFGCCGAIMENQCMLLTYFILVILIFLLEIVASVLAFVFRNEIDNRVKKELLEGIRKKWVPLVSSGQGEEGLTEGWAYVQQQLECCGVNNYTDWYKINAWSTVDKVPPECCKDNSTSCSRPDQYFQKGCLNSIKEILMGNLYIVGITCVTIILIQILGMTAAMVMFCCLRGEKYYD
jgi:tetraspanin-4